MESRYEHAPPTSSILTLNCEVANSEEEEDEEDEENLGMKALTYGIITIAKSIADFIDWKTTVKQQQGWSTPFRWRDFDNPPVQ